MADRLDFRILGPVQVYGPGGAPVRLAGARHERILALLLLRPGGFVAIEELVDVVWPERPPSTAVIQVQNCAAALRRGLAAAGAPEQVLVRRGPGYVLAVDDRAVDAGRFVALLAQGRAAARAGAFPAAVDALRRADALWEGPALTGLTDHALPLRAAAVHLEELRLQAVEERFALQIAGGVPEECLAELAAYACRHPLRDRLQASLIRALQLCGRTAEALDVYDRARRRLADEYGLDPSPELQDLQRLVLAGAGVRADRPA